MLGFAYIVYSHSEYLDILQIQNDHFGKVLEDKILLIDKPVELQNNCFNTTLYYDEHLNYSKRLATCVSQLVSKYEYILLMHDNDILIQKNDTDLQALLKLIKLHNISRLDFKFYRDPLHYVESNIAFDRYLLVRVNDVNNYIYNVQPSLYKTAMLLELMTRFDCSYRNIEHQVQEYCQQHFNTYRIYAPTFLHAGFFTQLTNIFTYFHITHNGQLCPLDDAIHPSVLSAYKTILQHYNLSRKFYSHNI